MTTVHIELTEASARAGIEALNEARASIRALADRNDEQVDLVTMTQLGMLLGKLIAGVMESEEVT